MKSKPPLIDTDILIDITKGQNPKLAQNAQEYIGKYSRYAVSEVTVAELAHGYYKRDGSMERLYKLLKQCRVVRLTKRAAILAGEIAAQLDKTGNIIGFADILIAAIAIENGGVLVTANEEHFQRVAALGYPLTIQNWRR